MTDGYLLGRGYIPATRLNLQQYIWKDTLGYVLQPRIPADETDLKIADIGTGTGIWLCHLAQTVAPGCTLCGYDISAEQFIPSNHLPSNVTLATLDATKEPPEHLRGYFDIVHIRLLQIVVDNDNPGPILDHCYKLLKPGGYLQWDEFDPAAQICQDVSGGDSSYLSTISKYTQTGKPISWIGNLSTIMEQMDLNVLTIERQRENQWQRGMLLEINAILSEEFAEGLRASGEVEKSARFRGLIQGAADEGRQGSYVSQVFQVVVAQKKIS